MRTEKTGKTQYRKAKRIGITPREKMTPIGIMGFIALQDDKNDTCPLPIELEDRQQLLCALGEEKPTEYMDKLYWAREFGGNIKDVYLRKNTFSLNFLNKDNKKVRINGNIHHYMWPLLSRAEIYFQDNCIMKIDSKLLEEMAFYDIGEIKIPELPPVVEKKDGEKYKILEPAVASYSPLPVPPFMFGMVLQNEMEPAKIVFVPLSSPLPLISPETYEKMAKGETTRFAAARKRMSLNELKKVENQISPVSFLLSLVRESGMSLEYSIIKGDYLIEQNEKKYFCEAKNSYMYFKKGSEEKVFPTNPEISLSISYALDSQIFLKSLHQRSLRDYPELV